MEGTTEAPAGLTGLALSLARAFDVPWTALSDDEACARLAEVERLGRLIDAQRLAGAAEIEARSTLEGDGLARRHGCIRGYLLVERITRVSQREAQRRARLGALLAPRRALEGGWLEPAYPVVAAAVAAGELGLDSAATITRRLDEVARRADRADLDAAEQRLVEVALTEPADLVRVHAQQWQAALDPDGAEPRERLQHEQRGLRLGRTDDDGMTTAVLRLEPLGAAFLRTVLADRAAPTVTPRFLDPDDAAADDAGGLFDPRRREQKQYDVLLGMLMAGVRSENSTTGSLHSVASVNVTVRQADLLAQTGIAELDDVAEAISAATARRLACDAGIRRAVLGEHGEVLWLGARVRYFSAGQRRALAVRDGGCVWTQCTAPPGWCEAHHVVEWSRGGPTDIDNGMLLCSFHHHLLHSRDYRVRMIDGRPHLLSPPWLDREQKWRLMERPRVRTAA